MKTGLRSSSPSPPASCAVACSGEARRMARDRSAAWCFLLVSLARDCSSVTRNVSELMTDGDNIDHLICPSLDDVPLPRQCPPPLADAFRVVGDPFRVTGDASPTPDDASPTLDDASPITDDAPPIPDDASPTLDPAPPRPRWRFRHLRRRLPHPRRHPLVADPLDHLRDAARVVVDPLRHPRRPPPPPSPALDDIFPLPFPTASLPFPTASLPFPTASLPFPTATPHLRR
ncbi:hypothetical protein EV122DRAFT_284920 [Schizophyllum commune]